MNDKAVYIGVDVSKEFLDIDSFDSKPAHIPNSKAGIRRLIERIKNADQHIIICCESTGGCERLLCDRLTDAGLDAARVDPQSVRDFAKSRKILARTDQLDAKVLSLFGTLNNRGCMYSSRSGGPRSMH
ncbi:MAG: transposase [Kiritimatiellales bacterium]